MNSAPQLRINKSLGQIGINKTKGYFKINKEPPDIEIDYGTDKKRKVLPDIKIDNPEADFKIDQSKCREDYGYYRVNSLIKHIKNKNIKKTVQSIKEIAREGDYLAGIEKNHKISEVAKKELDENKKQFRVGLVPESKPEISVKTYSTKVDIEDNKMRIDSNFSPPSVDYKPTKVDIYMKEKGYLEMEVIGAKVDISV